MSLDHSNAAWDLDLKPPQKLVMLCLANHANKDAVCWPSIDRISRLTCLSESTVYRAISQLKSAGFLSIESEGGGAKSSRYHINLPLSECDPCQSDTPVRVTETPVRVTETPVRVTPEPFKNLLENRKKDTSNEVSKENDDLPALIVVSDEKPEVGEVPKQKPKSHSKGTRLSEDWYLPKEWGQWAVEQGWTVDAIRVEADTFKDFWISKSGQNATKRDWFATWRNWIRNSKRQPERIAGNAHRQPGHGLSQGSFGPCTEQEKLRIIARLAEREGEKYRAAHGGR